ncbi:hypothetical protein ASG52_22210 [Methylobacterium sp. Leaf456]|uniref:hypothetical protein n=1 Tax=Methylobacterium sp. Leaf456 TaxID=1736382 RepID=UPI0007015981|nr:hypothetical protein [Methylobacterium sp. Leaf456]KQT58169.1 hypothetical protein ASG52_22210 [Methylobacterium sp. Leaf456]
MSSTPAPGTVGSEIVMPTGATVSDSVADLFGRTITAIDRGAQPGVTLTPVVQNGVTVGYSASGTNNAVALNNYADWCRTNRRPFILPPGDYLVSGTQLKLGGLNVQASGARIYIPNTYVEATKANILFGVDQADVEEIPLAQVKSWTGWTRRSRAIGGLTNRQGQYVFVTTPEQTLLKRVGTNRSKDMDFGEGFYVADATGLLSHTLYGTANNTKWTGVGDRPYRAVTCRETVVVEGLHVVVYWEGTASEIETCVLVSRPFTDFRGCRIENASGRSYETGFGVAQCCNIRFYSCHVEGAGSATSTNYGWNTGLCAGIEFYGCSENNCRRGIDSHRSKHIAIFGGNFADGIGAHYAWWMGATGTNLGPNSAPQNSQAFQVAGGGFYLTNCTIVAGPKCDAVFRIRDDLFECGDGILLEGNHIILMNGDKTTSFCLVDGEGPLTAFNFNILNADGTTKEERILEMPRRVSIQNNVVEDRRLAIYYDTNGDKTEDEVQRPLCLFQFLKDWSSAEFKSPIEMDMDIVVAGNSWKRLLPGVTTSSGRPWIQAYYTKALPATGAGIRARISDVPTLFVQTYGTSSNTSANPAPVTPQARLSLVLERIPGTATVRYGRGAYKTIDAMRLPNFTPEFISSTGGYANVGDETIVRKVAITGSRGGNVALGNLLTQLSSLDLITNNTTA